MGRRGRDKYITGLNLHEEDNRRTEEQKNSVEF